MGNFSESIFSSMDKKAKKKLNKTKRKTQKTKNSQMIKSSLEIKWDHCKLSYS